MPKLNLDPEHLSDFLNEPNIESTTPSLTQLMPPLPCRMTITLDDVVPYDRNPRRKINPNYNSIKESIRNRGLDDEPTITRRSPDEPFMIRSGGNTRLTILRELYQESLDQAQLAEEAGNLEEAHALRLKAEDFYRFEWNYKPWEGETNALIGHMAENEERGDMIYVEKSLAVKELQELYSEGEKKPLSSRKLAEKITQSGWTISYTSVSLMLYVINELKSYLEQALWAGLGSAPIIRLRALNRAYEKFCATQNLSEKTFQEIWHSSLTTCDDEDLDINMIRRYADQQIADKLGMEYFTITAEIDAILAGNKKIIRETPLSEIQSGSNVIDFQSSSTELDNHSAPIMDVTATHSTNEQIELNTNMTDSEMSGHSQNQPPIPSEPLTAEELREIQLQVYDAVLRLSVDYSLEHYMNQSQGIGFHIEPYEGTADVIEAPKYRDRNAVWLYLKQLSMRDLFLSQPDYVPLEQALQGAQLDPNVFFTLNSHFHFMRLTDTNLHKKINQIEKAIQIFLRSAENFYGKHELKQLFKKD